MVKVQCWAGCWTIGAGCCSGDGAVSRSLVWRHTGPGSLVPPPVVPTPSTLAHWPCQLRQHMECDVSCHGHDVKINIVCVSKQNKDYKHSVDQPQSAGWLSVITFSYHCSIRINVETLQRFIVNYGLEINMCAEQNSMNCTASTPIDISFCIQRIYESISEVCMYQYLVFQNSAIVFVP